MLYVTLDKKEVWNVESLNEFTMGALRFGQGENGMYWAELRDEYGDVKRARTGHTMKDVLDGIED